MYRVLIAAFANYDAVTEIPAILKEGGCTVDIYCAKGSWAIKSNHYDKWIQGAGDVDSFRDDLIELATKKDPAYDWIILADDPTIRVMNDYVEDNVALFYRLLPLTKIENRELLGTKSGFSQLCTKYGIRTPKYLIYDATSFDVKKCGSYIGYPMLLKIDKSEGGGGVFFCDDEAAVLATIEQIKERDNLVIQQYIKGGIINVEVLYKNGELLVYNYSKTAKTLYNEFGVSTQRLCYTNTEVEPALLQVGRSFGVNGFGNVVFIYNETEQMHYLIEVDIRPNAWIYYSKFCGNDFSRGVKNYVTNNLTLVHKEPAYDSKEVRVILFKKDVARCLIDKDLKGLLGWMVNKNGCWKFIPWYDRVLLFATLGYLIKLYWEAISNKLFKKSKK
ncbi:MAG: hypothetical protein WCG87_07675 [Bacteroidota bacterium]